MVSRTQQRTAYVVVRCITRLLPAFTTRIQLQGFSAPRRAKRAYNAVMARGWESKSVAEQIESTSQESTNGGEKRRTPEQAQRMRERRTLELARAKAARELEASQNPRHAEMLKRALAELDLKLTEF